MNIHKSNILIFTYILIICFSILVLSIAGKAIMPFIMGFVIAYILKPLHKFLSEKLKDLKFKHSKLIASISIVISFIIILTVLITLVSPFLISQAELLIKNLPNYKVFLLNKIIPKFSNKVSSLDPSIKSKINIFLQNITDHVFDLTISFINNAWNFTMTAISILLTIFLSPIIAAIILYESDSIKKTILDIIPKDIKEFLKDITSKIDILLSGYIRGQINICIILSIYYSLMLSFSSIEFPLILGFISGFMVIIPFIGPTICFLSSFLFEYLQGGYSGGLIYITFTYILAHFIEVYMLSPRIIGNKIGLHPLWIVFSILLGAELFGIKGMIISIPLAGITKILLKTLLKYN